MTFEEKLAMHARVLVRVGVNIQAGQVLRIVADSALDDFVALVAQEAFRAGAKDIDLELVDQRLIAARIACSTNDEHLDFVPSWVPYKGKVMVDEGMATLRIDGAPDTSLFAALDPTRFDRIAKAKVRALNYFYAEGIMPFKIQWSIGAAATPWWAAAVFPDEQPDQALGRLWDAIFAASRSDRLDALEAWAEHNARLHVRRDHLNTLAIDALDFRGPATDLRVGLSPKAVFLAGSKRTPRGIEFNPNIPTEEVFTAPDWRRVNGTVRVTRPVEFNGVLVSDLQVDFFRGEIVEFAASEGEEAFSAFLKDDVGARRLGEVALVGIDSPIFQSGLTFEEILFDENAACHIAFGKAYAASVDINHGNPEEQDAQGFNRADVHHDVMISDEYTDVIAMLRFGEELPLIKQGQWVI